MNNTSMSPRWIANANLPVATREPLLVRVGGAGDALRGTLPRYAEFNRTSQRHQLAFEVNDPQAQKAITRAREAQSLGLSLRPHERSMQEALRERPEGKEPLLVQIDDAKAMGEVVDLVEPTDHPLLMSWVVLGPTDRINAFVAVVEPGNKEQFAKLRAFVAMQARFQAPGGGRMVLGDEARAEHRALRPAIRGWMAARIQEALLRMAAGLRLEQAPILQTPDGINTTPVFIHQGSSFSEPRALAEAVSENPSWRVRLGAPVTIAEVADNDGLRFHRVRRRVIDRRFSVQDSSTVLSEEERKRAETERREAAEALQLALTRSERETVNQQAPLVLTD